MLFNATGIVPTAGQLYRPLTNVHQTPLDPANNLGYGLGRLVRAALDQLGNSWQRKGTLDVLSSRRSTIYQQRFQEWEKQCDKALGTLRINPHDPTALRKIEKLVHQYAVSPRSDEEAALQKRGLRSLAGKIEQMTHPRLRQALDQVLPSAKSSAKKRALQQSGYPPDFDNFWRCTTSFS